MRALLEQVKEDVTLIECVDCPLNERTYREVVFRPRHQVVTEHRRRFGEIDHCVGKLVEYSADISVRLPGASCYRIVHPGVPSMVNDHLFVARDNGLERHQVQITDDGHGEPILYADALTDNPFVVGEGVFGDRTHLATHPDHDQRTVFRIDYRDIDILGLVGAENGRFLDYSDVPLAGSGCEQGVEIPCQPFVEGFDESLTADSMSWVLRVDIAHLSEHQIKVHSKPQFTEC